MPDTSSLAKYYEGLTNAELLNLMNEGGFTDEAKHVLAGELRRRNLGADDLERYEHQGKRIELQEETTEKGYLSRGTGLLFFGSRYLNSEDRRSNIQLRTKWFAIGGVPQIPIASYRFQCSRTSGKGSSQEIRQRVINRVALNWTQIFLTWLKTAVIVTCIVLAFAGVGWLQNHRRF